MKKTTLLNVVLGIALYLLSTMSIFSAPKYGMAGCGLGSLIFSSNGFLQVSAATTNGIYGNQTFGITSGTSNCTADGIVKNEKIQETFVAINFESLEQEMASGKGEKLNAFAHLLGCGSGVTEKFGTMTKDNFSKIITESSTPSLVLAAVKDEVKKDASLSKACKVL